MILLSLLLKFTRLKTNMMNVLKTTIKIGSIFYIVCVCMWIYAITYNYSWLFVDFSCLVHCSCQEQTTKKSTCSLSSITTIKRTLTKMSIMFFSSLSYLPTLKQWVLRQVTRPATTECTRPAASPATAPRRQPSSWPTFSRRLARPKR